MKKRAVIIDDEIAAVESLTTLLNEYCPDIKVVATANSIQKGIDAVESYSPDILFLDIEMPTGSGFEVVAKTSAFNYQLIFTTAYEQYALKAIKSNALDYLLKPIEVDELKKAVEKAIKGSQNKQEFLEVLKSLNVNDAKKNEKISIPSADGYSLLETNKIIRVEADSSYSKIYTNDKKVIHLSKNLREMEDMLSDKSFLRIHNSHLVNVDYIERYSKADGGFIQMKDGNVLPISRNKKEEIAKLFM